MKNHTSSKRSWREITKPRQRLPPRPLTIEELKKAVNEGIVVGFVASHTKKNVSYAIRLDVHNVLYCECDGWYFRHACSHLDDFRAVLIRASSKRDAVKRRKRPH